MDVLAVKCSGVATECEPLWVLKEGNWGWKGRWCRGGGIGKEGGEEEEGRWEEGR